MFSCTAFAQVEQIKSDTLLVGEISGLVKDSSLNFYLQSSTIAIYKSEDNRLLAYSLANSLGEFHIKKLPLSAKLYIRISYIGYAPFEYVFYCKADKKHIDVGTVYLAKDTSNLGEVVVSNSPIRMHGDTLEFSALAFKLEKNAVAEDLLRVLPGIIIWGDGLITINGKPVNKLLVDGKPFFGGDTKIAIQNIPKTSIDKVQIFQEAINPYNPFDSITSINLKLRRDHRVGYFGLASLGEGTTNKNETVLNNSIFTGKNQLSIVGQSNNTNKLANDITSLLRNSTYKGSGVRVEYQPDFNMEGSNKQNSGGLMFTHDFIPDFNEHKKNRLYIQSFLNQTLNTTKKETNTTSTIGVDSSISQANSSEFNSKMTNFIFDARYIKKFEWDSLLVSGSINSNKNNLFGNWQNTILNSNFQLLSNSNLYDSSKISGYNINLSGTYYHHGFYNSEVRHLTDWSITYQILAGENNRDRQRESHLLSPTNVNLNERYIRSSKTSGNLLTQNISFNIGNLAAVLFSKNKFFSRFNIQFFNDFKWQTNNQNDFITDFDTSNHIYVNNTYLSRNSSLNNLLESTGFKINRSFLNLLANRYQKDFTVDVNAKIEYYSEGFLIKKLNSTQKYSYSYFTPRVVLSYSNYQYGEYLNRFSIDFDVNVKYPNAFQRYLLSDSSESYVIQNSNYRLNPEKKYLISFNFSHDNYRSKRPISYGLSINAGMINNFIGDSVMIDNIGRYFFYPVNINNYKIFESKFYLRKAIVSGKNQIQLTLTGSFAKKIIPGYLGYLMGNSTKAINTSVLTQSDSLSIYYTFKNLFAVNLVESITYYKSIQSGFINGGFSNFHLQTQLGVGINLSSSISLNSNISYKSFPNLNVIPNKYLIWNASFMLRALKSKALEMKFSALDLLRQNKGIFTFGNNYSFSQGTVNLLQQYFMATLSYYPRKFYQKSNKKTT